MQPGVNTRLSTPNARRLHEMFGRAKRTVFYSCRGVDNSRYHVAVFFFQAEDGIRDIGVTGVQTCALPILPVAVPVAARRSASRPSSSCTNCSRASKPMTVG